MSLFCRLSLMGNTNWPFRGYVYWSIFKYKRMLRYFLGFLRTFALLMDSWQVVTHHCPMSLFVCSPIFCTSTSTYVILSVRMSDTIDVFPASLSLTKWLASCFSAGSRLTPGLEAQGSFSIPVKPRARAPGFQQTGHRTTHSAAFALSPPSPCLVPQCRTQTWTFPIWARLGEEYLYEWFVLKDVLSWLFCIQTQKRGHIGEPVLSHQTAADQFPSQLCTHLNQPTSLPNQFPNSTPTTLPTRTTCLLLFATYLRVAAKLLGFFAVCHSSCNSMNPL